MAANDFLTPQEAAREFRVSLGTVYNLIRSGKVPAQRIGSQYRISRRDLGNATRQEMPGFFSYTHPEYRP